LIDGGDGNDWLSFEGADKFSNPDDGRVRYRSTEGAGVNIDLASGGGWSYYANGSSWINEKGRLYISNIENLRGTNQADRLIGNAESNVLDGGGGADFLDGAGGDDRLITRDTRYSDSRSVQVFGGDGNDTVQALGVFGRTVIDGGSGTDWLSFESANAFSNPDDGNVRYRSSEGAGVNIDLAWGGGFSYYANGNTWWDEKGRLYISNVENLRGTNQADRLIGNAGKNVLDGGGGADILDGAGGNDWLITRDMRYSDSRSVQVFGGEGNDTVQALGVFGRTVIDGGSGTDWLSFEGANAFSNLDDGNVRFRSSEGAGVNIDLAWGGGYSYYANGNTWRDEKGRIYTSNIENLRGTNQADRLIGNAGMNVLDGGGGADILDGAGGDDWLITRDMRYSDSRSVQVFGGDGNDTVQALGVFGRTVIDGGSGTDWLSFESANAFSNLDDGNVRYRSSEGAGVNIDLAWGGGFSYYVNGNTWWDEKGRLYISNVENLRGTNQADRLIGDSANNTLEGGAGNDLLNGGAGSDVLVGGSGADQFFFTTALGTNNVDTVKDFSVLEGDKLLLDDAVFAQLTGKSNLANHFRLSTQAAVGGDDYIVYNTANGELRYDASGTGAGTGQLFAVLENRPQDLTALQFVVI
jgi:serralysin